MHLENKETENLQLYVSLSSDIAFAKALHQKNGIKKLLDCIEIGAFETFVIFCF